MPNGVMITKPDGTTTLFDLDEVLMGQFDPEKKTLKLEFKNQSTSVLSGGPWVEQLWNIMKKRMGFPENADVNRSAWSKELSVQFSGTFPGDPQPEGKGVFCLEHKKVMVDGVCPEC